MPSATPYTETLRVQREELNPVTTEYERERAKWFNARTREPTYPCTGCGQFAFFAPTLCYWCQRWPERLIGRAVPDAVTPA